jgi:hypothetical protein
MKPRFWTLTALVLIAALSRVIPHPWNATPIAALALFGGAHFSSRRSAYLVPLVAMIVSNVMLGSFYDTLPFVYASFVLTVYIGTRLRDRRDALTVASASLVSSLAFFAITNAGHWLVSGMYPRTGAGLASCFVAAIPFFRGTVAGDLLFTGVLFGGFALLERRYPALRDPVLSVPLRLLPR